MDDESTGIEYVPLCRVGVTPGGAYVMVLDNDAEGTGKMSEAAIIWLAVHFAEQLKEVDDSETLH